MKLQYLSNRVDANVVNASLRELCANTLTMTLADLIIDWARDNAVQRLFCSDGNINTGIFRLDVEAVAPDIEFGIASFSLNPTLISHSLKRGELLITFNRNEGILYKLSFQTSDLVVTKNLLKMSKNLCKEIKFVYPTTFTSVEIVFKSGTGCGTIFTLLKDLSNIR